MQHRLGLFLSLQSLTVRRSRHIHHGIVELSTNPVCPIFLLSDTAFSHDCESPFDLEFSQLPFTCFKHNHHQRNGLVGDTPSLSVELTSLTAACCCCCCTLLSLFFFSLSLLFGLSSFFACMHIDTHAANLHHRSSHAGTLRKATGR